MRPFSHQVFNVLASSARRRLAISLLGVLALGFVSALSTSLPTRAHIATTLTAAGPWLDRLNAWRGNTGTTTLTEDPSFSSGDGAHALYMVKNNLVTHYETAGVPYYTAAGDAAARASNIFVSSSTSTTDNNSIDWWMGAPFHAMAMMDPRLSTTGFGSYRDAGTSPWGMGAAVDVIRGNSFSGGTFPVYFPGNGTTEPLTTYSGNESPNPLQPCGYSMPAGLPVFVEIGGNIATTAGPVHSFTGNGVPLAHCVLDSNSAGVSSYLTQRGGVIVVPQAPLQTGVQYVVTVTVNSVPHTWSFSVGPVTSFNPFACRSSTGSTTPPLRAVAGSQITISGTASGCPNARFRFWVLPPGGPWQMVQDYSAASSYVWNSPPTAGDYHLEVDARDQTSPNSYDAAATIVYTLLGCSSAWLSPSAASPQTPGTTVTLSATSARCINPEYKFFIQPPGGSWTAQTAYGGATWAWNTTGLTAGTYGIGVWTRTAGSTASYDAYFLGTYTLTTTPCTATSLSTSTSSPQTSGASIMFTSAGCPGALSRFWMKAPGGSWTAQTGFGAGTWTWNTTGFAPGSYQLGVWAKQPGSANPYDAFGFTTFVLGAGSCNSAGLSPNLTAPQAPGTTVQFTATSNGCTSPQYKFWLLPPGGSWTAMPAYSSASTWSWNTARYAPGTYQVGVWAMATASAASYDAYFIGTFQLDVGPCSAVGISANPASPQLNGTSITFTASSTGCTSPSYKFWVLAPGSSTWLAAVPYGTSSTFVWSNNAVAGPYRIGVWAKQAGSTSTYDAYAIVTYWVLA